jgi:Holliday junction resolvase-like predicted endonuclease
MTQYRSGAVAERIVRDVLTRQGYIVVRSAGSRGPFDLVAINANEVKLIQVKRTAMGRVDGFSRVIAELKAIPVPANAYKELWVLLDSENKWVTVMCGHGGEALPVHDVPTGLPTDVLDA